MKYKTGSNACHLLLLLSLLPLPALAGEFYAGAGLAALEYQYSRLSTPRAEKYFAGYRHPSGFGAELAWLDGGEARDDESVARFATRGGNLSAQYAIREAVPGGGFAALNFKLGVYDLETSRRLPGVAERRAGNGFSAGLGLGYGFGRHLGLRAEYEYFHDVPDFANDRGFNLWSVSLELRH